MYFEKFEIIELQEYIIDLHLDENEALLFLIAEQTEFSFDELAKPLNTKQVTFLGGIFPAILNEGKKHEKGFIVKKLPLSIPPILVKNLDQEEFIIPELDLDHFEANSLLIFIDGLTAKISEFLSELFNQLGDSIGYLGGGCGSLTLQQKPAVFNNEGIFQDAALLAFLPSSLSLGIQHGWKAIQGPFVASSSQKNILKELNWQNAFDVYRDVVETDSGQEITPENFFEIAKGYPLGIIKENKEKLVRDPIAVREDNALVCVGEVPENTVLTILKGEPHNLIEAAHQASDEAIRGLNSSVPYDTLIIDCISRVLYLEHDFEKEMSAIQHNFKENIPELLVQGALTLGEIASDKEYIAFHNKTVVIGLLY